MNANENNSQGPDKLEPWPLGTDVNFRAVAWPRYDEVDQLQMMLQIADPLFDNADACLCLRYDPTLDISMEQVSQNLQAAFDASGKTGDLNILFLEEEMTPADWPRLGLASTCVIRTDPETIGPRADFIKALGVEILSGVRE